MKRRSKTLGWWRVTTGQSASDRGETHLGVFYGHVDEIALRLADQQAGFWCDGKLVFTRVKEPKLPKLPKLVKTSVNIEVREIDWNNGPDLLEKNRDFFQGRPVKVLDCSLYGAVTLLAAK